MTDLRADDAKGGEQGAREVREPASAGELNERTAKRQRMLLAGIATVILAGTSWIIFGSDHSKKARQEGEAETIETASLVNRNLSQREFTTVYGNQLGAVTREQKALKEGAVMRPEMEAELSALKAENQAMRTDGQAAIDAISAENTQLKNQLQTQASTPAPNAAAMPAYGPRAGGYDARGSATTLPPAGSMASAGTGADGAPPPAEVKLLSFTAEKGGSAGVKLSRADAPPLVVEDSPDYLPPNSYARARVIVGVDASAGVASQTDPLPVVLRITGPARSALQNGRVLTTRLQGCVINGAARGDLSSEKVYVKLARMTCDQPGGRVAVSEVKGFISFAGKSGVRGRVVSREGNLVTQALLAGIVGGFGRGFSANANSVFGSNRTNPDGSKAKLSPGDILGGGLGQGAADAADTVSKYLIERAEQYQPVVEMPTGMEVEVVFLDGVYVRNSK
jgi:conjugal transfer pilus assembly protein TraB